MVTYFAHRHMYDGSRQPCSHADKRRVFFLKRAKNVKKYVCKEKKDKKIGGEHQMPVYKSKKRSIFISSARHDDVSQLRLSFSTSLFSSSSQTKYVYLLFSANFTEYKNTIYIHISIKLTRYKVFIFKKAKNFAYII